MALGERMSASHSLRCRVLEGAILSPMFFDTYISPGDMVFWGGVSLAC